MSKWTEQEEKILIQLAEAGCTVVEIKEVLKSRTRSSINNKAQVLGISLGGNDPEIDEDALERILKLRKG